MSLTIDKNIDEISVSQSGAIFCREVSLIFENGVEIAKTYNRFCLTPGQNTTSLPANVVAICNTVWTQEVIDAYNAQNAFGG